ncbi:MAG: hypothetical protein O3B73_13550 [bacterium]|nr:hypothetical protein [bacterium]
MRWTRILLAFLAFLCGTAPIPGADIGDLFDDQKLSKEIKAEAEQTEAISKQVTILRETVKGYQLTRAKMLCEATLWQGHIPKIKVLRSLRKAALDSVDATLAAMKLSAQLSDKQMKHLDKIRNSDDSALDYPVAEHPYYYVQNSPVVDKFRRAQKAYQISLPGTPSSDNTWTYAQLLETWTTRGYIPAIRPIDDLQNAPDIASASDLQTRVLPTSERGRIIKSPLLISATLLIPDLGKAEFDLLKSQYAPDSVDVTTWADYAAKNHLDDMIQVRLKLNTPYNEKFLDLSRWVIFLEDADGVGYEPLEIAPRAFYRLEAVEVSVPGRQVEVTDVFGQYFSPIPGEKERFYLEAPSRMTYVGNEKLIQLFFPASNFQGKPIIDENTAEMKLIVQSQESDFGRSELIWHIDKPKNKVRPPKG